MDHIREVDFVGLLSALKNIPGISFKSVNESRRIVNLNLVMPLDLPSKRAVIDVHNDRAYIDVIRRGDYTPVAYLAVCDVLARYDLQPLMPTRRG